MDLEAIPAIFLNEDEGEPSTQGPTVATTPQLTDAEEDVEDDEADQPTLADILRGIHKCTASVDTLKKNFLQKIQERTTAVEGRVSDA